MAVPGRTDRAFYREFIRAAAAIHGLDYVDLDSSRYVEEKKRLINEVAPQEDQLGIRLRGVSTALLRGRGSITAIAVWPIGGETARDTLLLFSYQLGLEEPTLSYFVVAKDPEKDSAQGVLQGLLDSLAARHRCVRSSPAEKGRYYVLLRNVCGKTVNLLLIAQSLEDVDPLSRLGQHAVEDFVVYLCWSRCQSLLGEWPRLWGLVRGNNGHKKLAVLAAVDRCRPGVDEKFFRQIVTVESVKRLCSVHDGVAKLSEVLKP